jgi:biopolymer transport protein ExbD
MVTVMKSKKKSAKQVGLSEINLTSLVDVCLTLVIIFMVSYPMVMQSGINVSTPSLQKTPAQTEETELKAEIYLRENSTIELNGKVIDPVFFSDSLKVLLAASKNKLVLISADQNVLHDQVVAVLDEAKICGAKQLSIVRKKPAKEGI